MPISQLLGALVERLARDGAFTPIAAKRLYIEQPMPRDITRASPLGKLGGRDFIIDEADDTYDAFPGGTHAGLSRHFLEVIQGHLQVDRQRDPRRQMERGAAKSSSSPLRT